MRINKTQSRLFTNSDLEKKLQPGVEASGSSADYNEKNKEAR